MITKKINVMLFPSCSEVAMASHECLKNNRFIEIFGGSSNGSVSKNTFKNIVTGIPNVKSSEFIDEINKVIKKFDIDIIFPCNDLASYEISKNINKINCKIIGSSFEANEIAFHKSKTHFHLKNNVNVPRLYNDINEIELNNFPLFLKPDSGHSAINTFKVNDFDELKFYLSKFDNLLIFEYLPGEEYTVDCFTNKIGKLIYVKARERVSIKSGMSSKTIMVNDNSIFLDIATKINEKIKFRNGWFFQLKKNKMNELCLMEISARPAGNSEISLANNVNIPLISVYDILDYDVEIVEKSFVVEMSKIHKAKYNFRKNDFKRVYIDLDDTIIINNEVNVDAIKFLYDCINQKKEIFLITRHRNDVLETLSNFKISSSIFNKIIHIQNKDLKSEYIDKNYIKESIFIDDSFAERKDLFEIGVDVYGVEMISKIL